MPEKMIMFSLIFFYKTNCLIKKKLGFFDCKPFFQSFFPSLFVCAHCMVCVSQCALNLNTMWVWVHMLFVICLTCYIVISRLFLFSSSGFGQARKASLSWRLSFTLERDSSLKGLKDETWGTQISISFGTLLCPYFPLLLSGFLSMFTETKLFVKCIHMQYLG